MEKSYQYCVQCKKKNSNDWSFLYGKTVMDLETAKQKILIWQCNSWEFRILKREIIIKDWEVYKGD